MAAGALAFQRNGREQPLSGQKPNSKRNAVAISHGLYAGLPCAAILRFGQSGRKIHLGLTFFASFLGQAKKEGVKTEISSDAKFHAAL
jgi:hypothetical protein